MWFYILRRLLYNVPVYLGIIFFMMLALRVNDPIWAFLGKNASREQYEAFAAKAGLDRPFLSQYARFLADLATLNFSAESWDQPGKSARDLLLAAIVPSLAITIPALILTSLVSIAIGLAAAHFRGRWVDRALMIAAVLGMSISVLVYIVLGQYFGAFWLKKHFGWSPFEIAGYEPGLSSWSTYCLLPVLISVAVAMGYDTRFYRAVMVEECGRDYITTARAKGAGAGKVLFVHMLKNAMIPIITNIMITLPFLIGGEILMEVYFNIPGMGRRLLTAIVAKDFPVVQVFTAMFAALFILTNILTDILYAIFDPRVRLS
ncbi:MAG: ABC transporter permease [Planctomycetes bacterium]|nr:ABC transporter permease [Planctomycetota bacterium]